MSAVIATLESIQNDGLMERAPEIFDAIETAIKPYVTEVCGHGCLIGVRTELSTSDILPALRKNGVLAGGSADPNVMRLMPPLITNAEHISEFADAFKDVMVRAHA